MPNFKFKTFSAVVAVSLPVFLLAPSKLALAQTGGPLIGFICQTAKETSAFFPIYKELLAVNTDASKDYEAQSSSEVLARQVLLPRAFPESLNLNYSPYDRKLRFSYVNLANQSQDGNEDLLEKLLFRGASEDPLMESLWIDDFKDDILRIPEVSLFRDKLLRQQKSKKAIMTLGDFSRLSDAIVAYLKAQNQDPRSELKLVEDASKWSWGAYQKDTRPNTKLLLEEFGEFVLMRDGNFGLIKISESADSPSLLGNAPAVCEPKESHETP